MIWDKAARLAELLVKDLERTGDPEHIKRGKAVYTAMSRAKLFVLDAAPHEFLPKEYSVEQCEFYNENLNNPGKGSPVDKVFSKNDGASYGAETTNGLGPGSKTAASVIGHSCYSAGGLKAILERYQIPVRILLCMPNADACSPRSIGDIQVALLDIEGRLEQVGKRPKMICPTDVVLAISDIGNVKQRPVEPEESSHHVVVVDVYEGIPSPAFPGNKMALKGPRLGLVAWVPALSSGQCEMLFSALASEGIVLPGSLVPER